MSRAPREVQVAPHDGLAHAHHGFGTAPVAHETRTRWVVGLTRAMMVGELAVGYVTNSMALTADGWHMATHAGALGLAAVAYWYARTRARSDEFSFGTGKVHALAGYTSAVALALVALWMILESVRRLFRPEAIAFGEALPVAVLGLAVNLVSVKLLHADHDHHDHGGDEDHDHDHAAPERPPDHAHDHNLRAAYLHVLADALTSVLAILALLGGRYLGWSFLDAAMGIVGGAVIARWSYGLCREASAQLLDRVPSEALVARLRRRIEERFESTRVVDLHLWQIGPAARACIVSVASPHPLPTAAYREALLGEERIQHLTVEVHALGSSPPER